MKAYLLVLPLAPFEFGFEYRGAPPLHCTIMPWFVSDKGTAQVALTLSEVFKKSPPVVLIPWKRAMFGKNNDVLVHVLTWEEGLIRLHNELLDALKTLEVELMDPQWTGANWNPHVTDHEGEKFFPGLQATVETAVMIEAEDPVSRPLKKVVARFPLRG